MYLVIFFQIMTIPENTYLNIVHYNNSHFSKHLKKKCYVSRLALVALVGDYCYHTFESNGSVVYNTYVPKLRSRNITKCIKSASHSPQNKF